MGFKSGATASWLKATPTPFSNFLIGESGIVHYKWWERHLAAISFIQMAVASAV